MLSKKRTQGSGLRASRSALQEESTIIGPGATGGAIQEEDARIGPLGHGKCSLKRGLKDRDHTHRKWSTPEFSDGWNQRELQAVIGICNGFAMAVVNEIGRAYMGCVEADEMRPRRRRDRG